VVTELDDGFIPVGTIVYSVDELERLLRFWVHESGQETVSDVGRFGGSRAVVVNLAEVEFVLNRDTKRSAVAAFLAVADRAGGAAHLTWHVTTNSRGVINRVAYRPDDGPTPGWYAYLRIPMERAQQLA
jgi:hypothetical protein